MKSWRSWASWAISEIVGGGPGDFFTGFPRHGAAVGECHPHAAIAGGQSQQARGGEIGEGLVDAAPGFAPVHRPEHAGRPGYRDFIVIRGRDGEVGELADDGRTAVGGQIVPGGSAAVGLETRIWPPRKWFWRRCERVRCYRVGEAGRSSARFRGHGGRGDFPGFQQSEVSNTRPEGGVDQQRSGRGIPDAVGGSGGQGGEREVDGGVADAAPVAGFGRRGAPGDCASAHTAVSTVALKALSVALGNTGLVHCTLNDRRISLETVDSHGPIRWDFPGPLLALQF